MKQAVITMKYLRLSLLFIAITAVIFASCKKDDNTAPGNNNNPPAEQLEGGFGGKYSVAIFPEHNGKGEEGRIYIKFAANKMPADTNTYDYRDNTMLEAGFGPHIHCNGLTPGTYYVYISTFSGKTGGHVFQLTDSSKLTQDLYLEVK